MIPNDALENSYDPIPDIIGGTCSRCRKKIKDYQPPRRGRGWFTAGYYFIKGEWVKYSNPGETIVCDACMFKDERYITDYGHHEP